MLYALGKGENFARCTLCEGGYNGAKHSAIIVTTQTILLYEKIRSHIVDCSSKFQLQ